MAVARELQRGGLSEDKLWELLLDHPEASVIVCGPTAKLVAERIVGSEQNTDGTSNRFYKRLRVTQGKGFKADEWEVF